MRPISLHHIMAPEVSAAELVQIAASLHCRHVCLFTQSPVAGWRFPVVGADSLAELAHLMTDQQVTAYGITSFAVQPEIDISSYEAGLERGGRLGAQYASVRIVDEDEARAADAFGRLGELAARYDIIPSIEFTGFKAPQTLLRTLRIIEAAGVGTLSIDPLHIVRSGASLEVMRGLDAARIGYVQLCDGPLEATEEQYWRESAAERLPPGEGAFPLDEILPLAPPGRPVSLEVPNEGLRAEGVSPLLRARRAVDATRRLLARLEPS